MSNRWCLLYSLNGVGYIFTHGFRSLQPDIITFPAPLPYKYAESTLSPTDFKHTTPGTFSPTILEGHLHR